MKIRSLTAALFGLSLSHGFGETRVLVSQAGTVLPVEVLALESNAVSVRRLSDNTAVKLPYSSLCLEDRRYLLEWNKRHPVISSVAASTKGKQFDPSALKVPPRFDLAATVQQKKFPRNRIVTSEHTEPGLQFVITLQNNERKRELAGAKATFALFTSFPSNPDQIIAWHMETFPVNVAALQKFEHQTDEIHIEHAVSSIGLTHLQYEGYALVVQDAANEIIAISAPDNFVKGAPNILNTKEAWCLPRASVITK